MDIVDKSWEVQKDIEDRTRRFGKGKYGRVLKMARKPTNEEIEYYRPYVSEIIRLVNPHIMLLTGNVACYSLLGQTGITRLRGQWTQSDGRWIMPIFHPSYLLRNPSKAPGSPKALMWDDIREVRKKFDELMGA